MINKRDEDELYIPKFFKECGHQSYVAGSTLSGPHDGKDLCFACEEIKLQQHPTMIEYNDIKKMINFYRHGRIAMAAWRMARFSALIWLCPRRKMKKPFIHTIVPEMKKLPFKDGTTLRTRRYSTLCCNHSEICPHRNKDSNDQ